MTSDHSVIPPLCYTDAAFKTPFLTKQKQTVIISRIRRADNRVISEPFAPVT